MKPVGDVNNYGVSHVIFLGDTNGNLMLDSACMLGNSQLLYLSTKIRQVQQMFRLCVEVLASAQLTMGPRQRVEVALHESVMWAGSGIQRVSRQPRSPTRSCCPTATCSTQATCLAAGERLLMRPVWEHASCSCWSIRLCSNMR